MIIETQIQKGIYQKDVAEQIGVHPKTVSRALKRGGAPSGRKKHMQNGKLDPYKPMIDDLLKEGVWNAMVIFHELQSRGFSGEITIVRDYIRPKRPLRNMKSTVRFETEPGYQMQNDWGEIIAMVAGRPTKVFFSCKLSWQTDPVFSRKVVHLQ